MATAVNKKQDLVLGEATYQIHPLKIKNLREFMKKVDSAEAKDEEKMLDVLSSAAEYAFESCVKELPEEFDFESEVDFDDVKFILKVCGGVDLDANLIAATA